MKDLKIATAQFENRSGDKEYNLSVMERLIQKAKEKGAEVISFHELSITAYTFLKDLSYDQLLDLAEEVPHGPSTQKLVELSQKYGIAILAGLVEREEGNCYNTYVCVDTTGFVAKYRKLHPFINSHLRPGNEYVVFDLRGWRCGILICYDNNVIENARATTLLGADLIFAPHVTMCTPSTMPGRGFVDPKLWENREQDPVSLRLEFDGPKGMRWLMRWLPARAFDNGIYMVFSNPIGMDGDQLKNGNPLILDPYGEVIAELKSFEDDVTVGLCTSDKLTKAGGYRYRNARRPELYRDILGQANASVTKPVWLEGQPSERDKAKA
jgi:predicted amidohydrolase